VEAALPMSGSRRGSGLCPARASLRAFALIAGLAIAAAAADAARSNWREMTVGHFHLYSTLGDSATRNLALQLQAFEQTIGELLQADDRLADVPTIIYVLPHDDFTKYAISRPAGGFFAQRDYANYIVIDGTAPSDFVRSAVFHEYTHFVQLSTSTVRYPPWYMEGYAELFSAFRVKDNVVTVGDAPEALTLSLGTHDWIPIERILAVKNDDPEYRAEKLMPQFYGEAWALVHFLLFDNKELRDPTRRYLVNIDLGFPELEAFSHAYPFDKAQLDAAVRSLLKKRLIVVKRLTYEHAPEIDRAPIIRVSVPQADAELARLTFAIGRPKEIVLPLMAAALAENPDDLATRALAARVAAHFGEPTDVDAVIGAMGSGNDAPRVQMDLADAIFTSHHDADGGSKAAALLDGIVHADSPPIEAVLIWARAAIAARRPPKSLIDVLVPAQAREPHNVEMLTLLASGWVWLGDRAKARDCYTRLILVGPTAEFRAWAVRQADSAQLQDPPAAKR
jgi:hypothetical protein